MLASKKIFFPSVIFIFSLIVTAVFNQIPESQLWKGYKIVYGKSEQLTRNDFYEILSRNGCNGIIYADNQKNPVSSEIAPIQVQDKDSYIVRRSNYFKDKTGTYDIYYVSEKNHKNLSKALQELNSYSETSAETENTSSFPWLPPFIALIFFSSILFLSQKKFLYAISCLPFLVLSFSRPYYTICASCCLGFAGLFLIEKTFGRRGFFSDRRNLFLGLVFLVFPAFFIAFSSMANSILFIVSIAGSFAAILLYEEAAPVFEKKFLSRNFNFTYIKSASAIKILGKNTVFIMTGLILSIILFFLFFKVSVTAIQNVNFSNQQTVLLPSPVSKNEGEKLLPDLDEMIFWAWNTVTFPYRRLSVQKNSIPQKNEKITVPNFSVQNGKIVETGEDVFAFDSSFINSIYDTINNLDYPALEGMLLSQGRDSQFAYTKLGGRSSEKNGSVILIFLGIIPLCLIILFFTGKLLNGHI